MFFGGTSFASAPFADPGFNPNALAIVTGSRINESTGTVGMLVKLLYYQMVIDLILVLVMFR